MKVSLKVKIAATVAAAALALSGCAPTTGTTGTEATSFSAVANNSAEGIHVVVMGGAPSDSFWSVVKNGTLDAALAIENSGGKVTVLSMPNYDNFDADAAKLVDKMLTLNPSAVVIPDWVPAAMNEGIKKLKDAGIIVVLYNSGQGEVENVGAEIYIGSDEYVAGTVAGEAMAAAGKKNVVCVNTLPGLANIEARCKGVSDAVKAAGGKSENLNLPSSSFGNATAVTQAVKAAITKDTTIDGLVTIGDADADSVTEAISQAGAVETVLHGGFANERTFFWQPAERTRNRQPQRFHRQSEFCLARNHRASDSEEDVCQKIIRAPSALGNRLASRPSQALPKPRSKPLGALARGKASGRPMPEPRMSPTQTHCSTMSC